MAYSISKIPSISFQLHVACSSDIADHCCTHALSADEDSFSLPCSHNHTVSCEGCINLSNALRDIKVAAMETEYPDEDIKDDIQYKVNRVCR